MVTGEFPYRRSCKHEAECSAAVVTIGVYTPMQTNGVDVVTSSATDETKYSVAMQGSSIETCACVSSKRQVAALGCHEDQLPQILVIFARHLNHGLIGVQKDLFQVSICATYIVTPHLAIAYLETGARGEKGNPVQGCQIAGPAGPYAETLKEVTEKTRSCNTPHPACK